MTKGLLTIILIVCVVLMFGSIAYSIYHANVVSKRNKEKDEANQKIFLAKIRAENIGQHNTNQAPKPAVNQPTYITNPIIKEAANTNLEKPKSLDYDSYESYDEPIQTTKRLRDFYDPT